MAGADAVWTSESELLVRGTSFRLAPQRRFASSDELFCVVKPPDLVARYMDMVDELSPARIVELGILQGGSTALLALLADPEKLVAFELSPTRIEPLDRMLAAHGLTDVVVPCYGVDQADAATMRTVLDREFGDAPLDLVIDDASHEVEPTEASFNVLFPRLRPGGLYIIEDWAWAHVAFGAHRPGHEPLTTFVFEALATLPQPRGLVEDIHVDRHWAVIRRAAGEVDPAGGAYDVRRICHDRGRDLVVYLRDRAGAER
jgi:predicted O-methyltransferase YrrM